MRKLTFTLLAALVMPLLHSINQRVSDTKSRSAPELKYTPASLFTLNGIPQISASEMVRSFQNERGSCDKYHHTCIWFSKAQLQAMYNVIANDDTFDGMRFYFARTIPEKKYTVVIVATKGDGLDDCQNDGESYKHNDFFLPTDPTLPGQNMSGILGDITTGKGAALFGSIAPTGSDNCGQAPHYITHKIAYEMVYKNISSDQINGDSEWFDKGIINDLLKAMSNDGGLRVYYARHSQGTKCDGVKRHGFVLIITKPDSLNPKIERDNFICLPIHPKYTHEYKEFTDGGGADNGQLCPNHCAGSTLPLP